MNSGAPYQVLLYYKFVPIADPQAVRDEHEALCNSLRLKGRILVAQEGINGTVSGLREDTEAYMAWMQEHPLFKGIEFKIDDHDSHTFLKMHVRVKNEIVRFDVPETNPAERPFHNYIEPEDFREILKRAESDPNIILLDARSEIEFELGKFKGALTLDIERFRQLPQHLEDIEGLREKEVYTYCTGGIKCEKVGLWLHDNGFKNVKQLHGGIVRYGKEAGGEDFEGRMYVFDQRVSVPVNNVNPTVIGKCEVCGTHSERIINCANAACNKHMIICDDCATRLEGCCSEVCMESPRRRQYDGRGYYLRGVNSKRYVHTDETNGVHEHAHS